MNKMLYNVTFDKFDENRHLIPCIPISAADDEDRETKRVCFADTVEHCISAMSSYYRNLYTGCQIVIRSVDENSLDLSKIITPEELFRSKKVPDALENHEYWYLDEVDVNREVYQITDYDYDYTIAFTCIEREDMASLIEKYTPDSPMKKSETIEQAYNRTVGKMQTDRQYDKSDMFEDAVASLPWAQRTAISNIVMKKVE